MPEIPLGTSSHNRSTVWDPNVRVVNYLIEQSSTNQIDGVNHIQRAGMPLFTTVGTGPIRGMFRQAGTFSGDFIAVSGEELYRFDESTGDPTLIGEVEGSDLTTFAATSVRAILTGDGNAYSTDGSTITTVVMPDDRLVSSVAQLNGYFILTERNSARFYWIEPGQTDPDGLSYATTESTPGFNRRVVRVGDELWFMKEEGVEVWVPTGDADLPFERVPGRNYDKGCINGDTAVRFDNTLGWVGNDDIWYIGANVPTRISDNALEEQIRKSSEFDMRSWSFALDGHTLLCLTLTDATYVYDALSQQITEFRSYGHPIWRGHVGDTGARSVLTGDYLTGKIYRLDPEVYNDDGDPLERIQVGGITLPGGSQACDSLDLYVTTGTTPDPSLYPKVRIRWSDDMQTYNDWRDVSQGRQGRYGRRVRLTRLGRIYSPGRLFEFLISDNCVATISAAAYNVPLS